MSRIIVVAVAGPAVVIFRTTTARSLPFSPASLLTVRLSGRPKTAMCYLVLRTVPLSTIFAAAFTWSRLPTDRQDGPLNTRKNDPKISPGGARGNSQLAAGNSVQR